MDTNEFYRMRAEDFGLNFHSLRAVEWQIAFQAYAGYAAIAVGFSTLIPFESKPTVLGWATIGAAIFVFLVTLYASLRVQERLHSTRRLQNLCLEKIERNINQRRTVVHVPFPANNNGNHFWFKVHESPIHGKWYAFSVQTLVSATWLLGLVLYVVQKIGFNNLLCWHL